MPPILLSGRTFPLPSSTSNSNVMASPSTSTPTVYRRATQTESSPLFVSASGDGTIRLWERGTTTARETISAHSSTVRCVEIHPSGRFLVSGSFDDSIKIWSIDTATCLHTFDSSNGGHSQDVNVIAISPSGRFIASGSDDHNVKLFDFHARTNICTLSGHTSRIRSLAFFMDDSHIISSGEDKSIKIWNIASRSCVYTCSSAHNKTVYSLKMHPDNTHFISGSGDNTLKIWRFNPPNNATMVKTISDHTSDINTVTISWDGTLFASGSDDRSVRMYDWNTKNSKAVFRQDSGAVWSVDISSDNQWIITGSSDNHCRHFQISNPAAAQTTYTGHTTTVYSVTCMKPSLAEIIADEPEEDEEVQEIEPDYKLSGYPPVDDERIASFGSWWEDPCVCPICSNVIIDSNPNVTSITPCCANLYCSTCLIQWLGTKTSCPSCRRSLTTEQLRPLNRFEKKALAGIKVKCKYFTVQSIARPLDEDTVGKTPEEIISELKRGIISPEQATRAIQGLKSGVMHVVPRSSQSLEAAASAEIIADIVPQIISEHNQNLNQGRVSDSGSVLSSVPAQPGVGSLSFPRSNATLAPGISTMPVSVLTSDSLSGINSPLESSPPSSPRENTPLEPKEASPVDQIPVSEGDSEKPKASKTCDFVGSIAELISHEKTCGYKPRKCSHRDCQLVVFQKDLERHKKLCRHRLIPCPTIGCQEKCKPLQLGEHLARKCKFVILPCPNSTRGCGCGKLRRMDLTRHLEEVCPLSPSGCRHSDIGCPWRGMKDNEAKHVEDECLFHRFQGFLYAAKRERDVQQTKFIEQQTTISELQTTILQLHKSLGLPIPKPAST